MRVWDKPKTMVFSIGYEPKDTGPGACEPWIQSQRYNSEYYFQYRLSDPQHLGPMQFGSK